MSPEKLLPQWYREKRDKILAEPHKRHPPTPKELDRLADSVNPVGSDVDLEDILEFTEGSERQRELPKSKPLRKKIIRAERNQKAGWLNAWEEEQEDREI